MFYILPAIFLGWSLGANDAANLFGPPVVSGLIKYRNATIIAAIFVVLGALIGGTRGLNTLGNLTNLSLIHSSMALFCAALTMTTMTFLGLPSSATQAVVGAIVGIGIFRGVVDSSGLIKIGISWIGTPIGAIIFSIILYKVISFFFRKVLTIQNQDRFIKMLTWIVGIYGSYALGANNTANVTGALVGRLFNVNILALIGGLSIAFGILTYGKKVMYTVGSKIIDLSHFSSMITIFSASLTVWIYSVVGVPVSSSQAIVGAVIGIGIVTGTRTFNFKIIKRIIFGWIGTPLISGVTSILFVFLTEVIF